MADPPIAASARRPSASAAPHVVLCARRPRPLDGNPKGHVSQSQSAAPPRPSQRADRGRPTFLFEPCSRSLMPLPGHKESVACHRPYRSRSTGSSSGGQADREALVELLRLMGSLLGVYRLTAAWSAASRARCSSGTLVGRRLFGRLCGWFCRQMQGFSGSVWHCQGRFRDLV